jgi:small subunit ribosomal protein S16
VNPPLAVKIRLRRVGKKKEPHYRIVVTDIRNPRDGKFIEIIGHYNPRKEKELVLDVDKVEEWENKGAKPTNTVKKLIKRIREQKQEKEKKQKKKKKKKPRKKKKKEKDTKKTKKETTKTEKED